MKGSYIDHTHSDGPYPKLQIFIQPNIGMTEVLALYDVSFSDVLASLMSKYARKIKP
jgi:hypothetical protein